MDDLFNNKFVNDLKNGKLPPVEVQFATESLVQVSVTLFITAVAILLTAAIVKKLGA
jgi:hypothetical protein